MVRAYLRGARAALQQWPLVLALWLIIGLFGLAFALAGGAWLSDALESSLATRTLFRSLDPDVWVDLWYHHREGLRGLLTVAVVLATVHSVLWWWLHGVVIAALQGTAAELGSVWARGLRLAPTMAALFAIALVVLALFTAAVASAAYELLRWTRTNPAPMIWYQIGAAAVAVWVLGFVFLVAVHDQARLRVGRARRGALSAYAWALVFVARGGERAFPLACALQLTGLAVWLGYQAIALTFDMTALLGLTGSFVWGEAFLLIRMWGRVWFFAAQNELQP